MPSKIGTINRCQEANRLSINGFSTENIAEKLQLTIQRIREYLSSNSHGQSCKICHGHGINWNSSSKKRTPICTNTKIDAQLN